MRIEKLNLKNFRGFEELEIDFPSKEQEGGLAVFIGVNGSGKTSVLRAISHFFRFFIEELYSLEEIERREKYDSVHTERQTLFEDVNKGKDFFENKITFNLLETNFISEIKIKEFSSSYKSVPPINRIVGEFEYPQYSSDFKREYGKEGIEQLKKLRKKLRNKPKIAVFYNVNRFVADEPSLRAKDITQINPIDAFSNSFSANISFDDFFEWFRNTEDYESENIRFNNEPQFRLKSLEAIRNTLATFLPKYSFPRVKRQPAERLVLQGNGYKLSIANLSHGERLIFAIVGDLIRRLNIANPDLENPHLGEGIVMIDEIEQHLHPAWQRTIIPNLRKTFPNIQFIVTTHSPQVLSNVPKENVFILEDFKLVEITPPTYGKDTNSILHDIFGVNARPDHARAIFKKLYDLIDDPAKEKEAAEMLKKLEGKYGKHDPDLIDAKLSFEFLTD